MRKLLAGLALVAELSLSACGTTGGLSSQQVQQYIAQIQTYVAQACGYQPAVASVSAVLAAFVPELSPLPPIVQVVGDAICKAPVTASVRRGGVFQVTRVVSTPRGPIIVKGLNVR